MSLPEQGDERRGESRAAITLRVDYKRMNTFFADYAKNISKGGTFIRTNKPLDIGTGFLFVLSIPGENNEIELQGEVVWTVSEAEADETRPPGMGIRFRFESEGEKQALQHFVEGLMRETLGNDLAERLLSRGR